LNQNKSRAVSISSSFDANSLSVSAAWMVSAQNNRAMVSQNLIAPLHLF
jgi:hypothetical protein